MKAINEILAIAKPLDVISGKQLCALLPLLEHTWSKEVSQQITAAGFQPEKLLTLALLASSDYWRGLAIKWIDVGYPLTESLTNSLVILGQSKTGTQQDRHAAFRFANQWKKMQNKVSEATSKPAAGSEAPQD